MALEASKNTNLSQRSQISSSVWADLARDNYTPSQLRDGQLGSETGDHLVFSDPFSSSSDYLQTIQLLTGRMAAKAETQIKSKGRGAGSPEHDVERGTTTGAATGDGQLYPWSPNWTPDSLAGMSQAGVDSPRHDAQSGKNLEIQPARSLSLQSGDNILFHNIAIDQQMLMKVFCAKTDAPKNNDQGDCSLVQPSSLHTPALTAYMTYALGLNNSYANSRG